MASFSDHLDNHLGAADTDPLGPNHDTEPLPDTAAAREPAYSGPDPRQIPGVEVLEMFTTVEGDRRSPDPRPDPDDVEEFIRQLKLDPAAIRGERLLPNRDAAAFLGITESTLRSWRDRNLNLPYYVSPAAGMYNTRRIYYRLADLIRYREFVMAHFTPDNVQLPPPGMMGTPLV